MTIYGYKMEVKGVGTLNECGQDAAFLEAIRNHEDGHCVIMLHASSDNDIQIAAENAPKHSTIIVVSEAVAANTFQSDSENVYLLNRSVPTQDPQDGDIVNAFEEFYKAIEKLNGNEKDPHQAVINLVKKHIDGKSHQKEKDEALKYISSLGNAYDD